MNKPNIGFVGLGVMGFPMAGHLAAAGYPLSVYDIDSAVLARVRQEMPGAQGAATPRAVAAASDIVITMLPNGREVESVTFGRDGLAGGFRRGALLLDTSSSEPWITRRTATRLADLGVSMVDAPVSGAEAGAKNAELVFMVGGDPAAVARAQPLFAVLGKSQFHLGPIGSGHAMKSINNLITAITFLATAEGLVIGRRYGLDPAVAVDVLNVSTGMSWISRTHIAQRILNRRFDDPFKLDLMVKDIDIALRIAADAGLDMRLARANQALWHEAQQNIPEGSSVSELVRAVEALSGVELRTGDRDTDGHEKS
jgi:3-hydroxyisobutyrate dehydrogenase-like beta-hydroxyacid dehydrogenase